MQRRPRSSRTGGCTFPEDPAHSCALVLPIWSAAADPRVVAVRALPSLTCDARRFDMIREAGRLVRGRSGEHVLVDRGALFRLDVIEGTLSAGPVSLHFDLPYDGHLQVRLAVIQAFVARAAIPRHHLQLAGRLYALHAADARSAGASLREIADLLLGAGDWPGDGEHRKSLVRRMIATGERMVRAGPRAILTGDGGGSKLQLTHVVSREDRLRDDELARIDLQGRCQLAKDRDAGGNPPSLDRPDVA